MNYNNYVNDYDDNDKYYDDAIRVAEQVGLSKVIEHLPDGYDTKVGNQAIETLPDREREVLVLKEFEGLKYREIAEVVGIPIGTVMSRLYSARRNLATAIEEMES